MLVNHHICKSSRKMLKKMTLTDLSELLTNIESVVLTKALSSLTKPVVLSVVLN